MSATIGTLLGRYEILGVIGRGMMGAVYKARDPKIDRLVAVKTIALAGQDSANEMEYRERFFQEARAAGRLSHPGIVTIFDVGQEPGTGDPYIVMEYVAGRQLDHLYPEGKKISPAPTLKLCEQIAGALDYAHRKGVIHRDIKPANILITREGKPKIADFGVAKVNRSKLTLPGGLLGSPAYMAPEQLIGEEIDGRADLFSLGVILYTMLAGHRPFHGNSTATVIYRVVHQTPLPLAALEPEISEELDKLVMRAIAKERSDRFQNGAEMAAAIRRIREKHDLDNESSHSVLSAIPATPATEDSVKRPNFITQQTERIRTMVPGAAASFNSSAFKWRNNSWKHGLGLALAVGLVGGIVWRGTQHLAATSGTAATSGATGDNNQTLSLPGQAPVAEAGLRIEIEHHFASAQASFWLDGKLIFSPSLKGEKKQRALLLRQTKGFISKNLRIVSGRHEMRVRVRSLDNTFDQTRTLVGDCPTNKKNVLRIAATKHDLMVTLR
jgi:serine/threonine protein kinase